MFLYILKIVINGMNQLLLGLAVYLYRKILEISYIRSFILITIHASNILSVYIL